MQAFLDVDSESFLQQTMACVVFDEMMYLISFQAHQKQERAELWITGSFFTRSPRVPCSFPALSIALLDQFIR